MVGPKVSKWGSGCGVTLGVTLGVTPQALLGWPFHLFWTLGPTFGNPMGGRLELKNHSFSKFDFEAVLDSIQGLT